MLYTLLFDPPTTTLVFLSIIVLLTVFEFLGEILLSVTVGAVEKFVLFAAVLLLENFGLFVLFVRTKFVSVLFIVGTEDDDEDEDDEE